MPRSESLCFDNLRLLDRGTIGATFDAELSRVQEDIRDRPAHDKARVVSINFKLAPVVDVKTSQIHGDEVRVEVEVTSTIPKRRTPIYTMQSKNSGELTFHPDLPDEPDGSTIFDDQAEREDHGR